MRFAIALSLSALCLTGSAAAGCVKKSSSTAVYSVTSSPTNYTAASITGSFTASTTKYMSSTTASISDPVSLSTSTTSASSTTSSSSTVPFCSGVVYAVESANDVGATAFCSSYLGVPVYTTTSTVSASTAQTETVTVGSITRATTVVTLQQTATSTITAFVTALTTVVSTSIVPTETAVSITSCAPLPRTTVAKRFITTGSVPDAISDYPTGPELSSLCNCLDIPKSTTTATVTMFPPPVTTTQYILPTTTSIETTTTTNPPSMTITVTATSTITLSYTSVTITTSTSTSYILALPTFNLAARYLDRNGDTSNAAPDAQIWVDQDGRSALVQTGLTPPSSGQNRFISPSRLDLGFIPGHDSLQTADLTSRFAFTQGGTEVKWFFTIFLGPSDRLVECKLVAGPGADGRTRVNVDGTCPLSCDGGTGGRVSFGCPSTGNGVPVWNVGSAAADGLRGCSSFMPYAIGPA